MGIAQAKQWNPELTEGITKGIVALKAGRRAEARKLLAQAVRMHPHNATAWYWLSRCVDDEGQRRECLERVKRLDQASITAPPASNAARPQATAVGNARQSSQGRFARSQRGMLLAALVVVLIAFVGAAVPRADWPEVRAQANGDQAGQAVEASGIIQAAEVLVASEYGGRIVAFPVGEGERVSSGDVVVQLDTALLDAQIEAARAAVAAAEAGLAQAKAGARPGQVAIAEAQLAQAQAARITAMQAVSDTMALLENPQEIRMQMAVLQAQLEAEKLRLAQKLSLKDAAKIGKDKFKEAQEKIMDAGGPGRHKVPIPGLPGVFYEYTVPSLPLEMHLAPNYWWQAWVGVNATAAQEKGMEATLNQLAAQRQHPQDLEAKADEALSALAQVEAQVAAAQARLDGLKAGATQEQIAALEARVAQARAALDSLLSQRAMMEIVSPLDGLVLNVAARPGEVAAPGATLLTVADLSNVHLDVYLPETQIGRISVGQRVQVTVDSFPDRVFEGQIAHIADQAEFTPRNVATQQERVYLVFAVEIQLPNDDGALKPGMPADAVLGQ